jgi:elongation factor G
VQQLLDAVVDYLPCPLDVSIRYENPKTGSPGEITADDSASLSAIIFKLVRDSYVGNLAFVRVYSGRLKTGGNVYNPRTRKRARISRLLRLHADSRTEVKVLDSGEIGAVVGLKGPATGDTLCTENAPVHFEGIRFPEPVMSMAIEPKARADRDKLKAALQALSEEDPTCVVKVDAETGQTLLSGMGELHLQILTDRLRRDYNVEANSGKPMVVYYETVTAQGRGEHRFDREIGGRRHVAFVAVEVSPGRRGGGNSIEWGVGNNAIPTEFRKHVEEGLNDGAATGVLARYPVVDVAMRVVEGAFDMDLSSDIAFRSAAVMAFRDAILAGDPVLLEPIMSLDVVTPGDYMGDVLGDLNSRRGKVHEMTSRGTAQIVQAGVPLAELFGYATVIRSLTKGRATYTMEPEQFDIVPDTIKEEILNR